MRAICALETSSRPPSVAVRIEQEQRERDLDEGCRHASDLLPILAGLLEESGAVARDLELVCVGIGPGSYTGLRVGIATAMGLARGTGAAVVSVPSVAALAHGALEVGQEGTVLLDARARELYFARYRREVGGVVELVAPKVTTAAELPKLMVEGDVLLGDATVADAAELDEEARGRLIVDRRPDATAVLELGLARFKQEGGMQVEDLAPLYLRPFAVTQRKR